MEKSSEAENNFWAFSISKAGHCGGNFLVFSWKIYGNFSRFHSNKTISPCRGFPRWILTRHMTSEVLHRIFWSFLRSEDNSGFWASTTIRILLKTSQNFLRKRQWKFVENSRQFPRVNSGGRLSCSNLFLRNCTGRNRCIQIKVCWAPLFLRSYRWVKSSSFQLENVRLQPANFPNYKKHIIQKCRIFSEKSRQNDRKFTKNSVYFRRIFWENSPLASLCTSTLRLGVRCIKLYIKIMHTEIPCGGIVRHNRANFFAKEAVMYAGTNLKVHQNFIEFSWKFPDKRSPWRQRSIEKFEKFRAIFRQENSCR